MELQHVELKPLPYQIELRNYLRSQEREIWNWFSSAQAHADHGEHLRLELLKTTYRLDPDGHPELYEHVSDVKMQFHLDIPVTLYQSQISTQANASLLYIEGEGHIVFSGSLLSLLSAKETKALIGHELAHYYLWSMESGDFQVVDRIMQATAADYRSAPSQQQSARWYGLYTEIFADRGSLLVVKDIHPVVGGLVKIDTGFADVSPTGYLKQAEEVFAKGNIAAEGLSHPETFIRARALALWRDQGDDAMPDIRRMIEGGDTSEELDLLAQAQLTEATRRLLMALLRPKWFQTPLVIGHARRYFDDFRPGTIDDQVPLDDLRLNDPRTCEYLGYVLLDFVTADPDLDEVPLAQALQFADTLKISAQFEKLVTTELKVRTRDLKRIRGQAMEILSRAEAHNV